MGEYFHLIINFDNFTQILPLVRTSLWAGLVLGIVAGLIGPMIQARDLAFAVHGASELSFAGASVALFLGISVNFGAIAGSIVAAILLAFMGVSGKNRNAIIGILLPFGLGLGVLFLALYKGRSSNKFGLLTGQIVSVDTTELGTLIAVAILVIAALSLVGRPMFFAAVDPAIARAKGVPVGAYSLMFMIILGLVTAMSVQLVGALLVLSLLITPTAAAARITASPVMLHLWSVIFAVVAAVGGILLSLGPGLPISPYVTTVSFLIYLLCWLAGTIRTRLGWGRRSAAKR